MNDFVMICVISMFNAADNYYHKKVNVNTVHFPLS